MRKPCSRLLDSEQRSPTSWADDKNTDNSEEVIRRHLGHIPGAMVTVHFDGMGPTWTELVEYGIKHFPNATHGIVTDADFTPITTRLDKWQLNTECSKHMYRIRSAGDNVRNMDWIYRNLPGAKVERRVMTPLRVSVFVRVRACVRANECASGRASSTACHAVWRERSRRGGHTIREDGDGMSSFEHL